MNAQCVGRGTFVEHRIGDRRIIRLLHKWLKAGVLEEGELVFPGAGTVQGGSISPLVANIYLHYVLDLWAHRWRRTQSRGEMIIVRYADDFVAGFEHREDGERFLAELRDRLAAFALELHPDKTRLLEFGRFAITICGLKTRFESSQGGGDDTAMNGLELACCDLP